MIPSQGEPEPLSIKSKKPEELNGTTTQGIGISHSRNVEEHGNRPKGCTSVNRESGVNFGQKTLIMRIQINEGWTQQFMLFVVCTHVVSGDAHTWLGLVKEMIILFACKKKS